MLGLAGSLLVVAALAKGYARLVSPVVTQTNWWDVRWVQFFFIELELLLGLWLIVGVYQRVARNIAAACFLAFAGHNFWQVWQGESSCNCFGTLATVDPLMILVVDLVVVLMILSIQIRPDYTSRFTQRVYHVASVVGLVCGLCGVVTHFWIFPADLLFRNVEIDKLELNVFPDAKSREVKATVFIRNGHHECIRITKIYSSCSCTHPEEIEDRVLMPGENLEIPLSIRVIDRYKKRAVNLSVFYTAPGYRSSAWKNVNVIIYPSNPFLQE
jgi:hypothetical protein